MGLVAFWMHLETWIQIWCITLFVLFIGAVSAMVWQLIAVRRRGHRTATAFEAHGITSDEERRTGRSLAAVEQLRETAARAMNGHPYLLDRLEQAVELYDSPDGRSGYFLTKPAADVVTADDAWEGYGAAFFRAVPGVLTSIGLLGTFVALLLGLNGLTMTAAGTVEGLPNLIQNLSGKFLTSICALGLSVVFLVVDLLVAQPQLRALRRRIVRSIAKALPLLTETRILLDIQRQSVKQATALGHISADVVEKFSSAFREDLAPLFAQGISSSMANQLQVEMGPTLVELRDTMRSLTATVERLEQSKQESVVGEIHGLVDSLERALRDTLGQMGQQFQQALTGSTKEEFGVLAEIIKGSADVVGQMGTNLTLVQSTLQSVVEETRKATTDQMDAGAEQTRRLNTLVEGLMVRLNDTANQNYEQLTGTLTRVVSNLSERVTALSEDLVKTVGTATERSQQAATQTLTQATEWTSQTREQINDILTALREKADRFDRAGDTLLEAQNILQTTLTQNREALQALGGAASEVKAYTTGLAGIQRQIEEGQKAQAQVATLSREVVAKLADAAERHDEFLNQYRQTFQQYRDVFDGMDSRIAAVLETILDRLQQYNRGVEQNFRAMVDSANNVMPRMAGVLKASAEEIKEHLDELSDVLDKGTARIAAVRTA